MVLLPVHNSLFRSRDTISTPGLEEAAAKSTLASSRSGSRLHGRPASRTSKQQMLSDSSRGGGMFGGSDPCSSSCAAAAWTCRRAGGGRIQETEWTIAERTEQGNLPQHLRSLMNGRLHVCLICQRNLNLRSPSAVHLCRQHSTQLRECGCPRVLRQDGEPLLQPRRQHNMYFSSSTTLADIRGDEVTCCRYCLITSNVTTQSMLGSVKGDPHQTHSSSSSRASTELDVAPSILCCFRVASQADKALVCAASPSCAQPWQHCFDWRRGCCSVGTLLLRHRCQTEVACFRCAL
jgi:hypothetical protein